MRFFRRTVITSASVGTVLGFKGVSTAAQTEVLPIELDIPDEASTGEEISATVTVDMPDLTTVTTPTVEVTVSLEIDDIVVEKVTEKVDADGEEREFDLEHTFDDSGKYEVTGAVQFEYSGVVYSADTTQSVDVPESSTVSTSGTVIPSHPVMDEKVEVYRTDLPENLPSEWFLLANREGVTLVFDDESPPTGQADVEGMSVDTPFTFDGVSADVIAANDVLIDTEPTVLSLAEVSATPEEFAFDFVRVVDGEHVSLAVRTISNNAPISYGSETGVLVDERPVLSKTFSDVDEDLYELMDEPSTESINAFRGETTSPFVFTTSFGSALWESTPTSLTGVILPAGTDARKLITAADTDSALYSDGDLPVLHRGDQSYDATAVDDISDIVSDGADWDGEIVTMDARVWQQTVSSKQTMEEMTGCGEDLVQFEKGCIEIIHDTLLHGGAIWTATPESTDDVLPLIGISSFEQHNQYETRTGEYTLQGELIHSSRLSEEVPEGMILLVYSMSRTGDIDLKEDIQSLVTGVGEEMITEWAGQIEVEGDTIRSDDPDSPEEEPDEPDGPEEHESGVDQELFEAVDQSGDSDVSLSELQDAVEEWSTNQQIDGVETSLDDLRLIVDWWAS